MAKPEFEFFPVSDVAWTPAQGGQVPGLFERILAIEPDTGVATRMLRFDPGTNTALCGATMAYELLCLLAEARVARRRR